MRKSRANDRFYTISADDVDKPFLRAFGALWPLDFIGHIMSIDVGKRVFKRNGILQVENCAQLKQRRLAEEKGWHQ